MADVVQLTADRADEAVALWQRTGLTRPWNDPHDDLRRALAGATSTVLAVVDDGRLTGTVVVGEDGHRGWVYYLAVDPEQQRQGLGRLLLSAAEQWLRERGVPKLNLMVRSENTAVLAFYEALGYRDLDCVSLGKRLD